MSQKPLRKTVERHEIPATALARVIQRKQTAIASINRLRKIFKEKKLDDGTIDTVLGPALLVIETIPMDMMADHLRDAAPYANDLLLFNREQLDFSPSRRADIVAVFKELLDVICDTYLAFVGFTALASYAYPDDKLPDEIGPPVPALYTDVQTASQRIASLAEYFVTNIPRDDDEDEKNPARNFLSNCLPMFSLAMKSIDDRVYSPATTAEKEEQEQEEEEQSQMPNSPEP